MHIEIIIVTLLLMNKKCNKYILISFILISSYLFLYHKSLCMSIPNTLNLYSLLNETTLMPQILDNVPF